VQVRIVGSVYIELLLLSLYCCRRAVAAVIVFLLSCVPLSSLSQKFGQTC
jgi:hypothetical protein